MRDMQQASAYARRPTALGSGADELIEQLVLVVALDAGETLGFVDCDGMRFGGAIIQSGIVHPSQGCGASRRCSVLLTYIA
jgi:hypothetical protein